MPEISEQDFAALAAQVASLSSALAVARRRIDDLEDGMTGHIGLDWGESMVDANSPHPNISVNTIESGGGVIRQSADFMQIDTSGGQYLQGIAWVNGFEDTSEIYAALEALANNGSGEANLVLGVTGGSGDPLTSPNSAATAINMSADTTNAQFDALAIHATSYLARLKMDARASWAIAAIAGQLCLSSVETPDQITSNQDNYTAGGRAAFTTVLRLSSDASRDITGIDAQQGGQSFGEPILILLNVGSFNIVLKNDVTSTPANRFLFPADITLAPNEGAGILYDPTSSRWRCFGRY